MNQIKLYLVFITLLSLPPFEPILVVRHTKLSDVGWNFVALIIRDIWSALSCLINYLEFVDELLFIEPKSCCGGTSFYFVTCRMRMWVSPRISIWSVQFKILKRKEIFKISLWTLGLFSSLVVCQEFYCVASDVASILITLLLNFVSAEHFLKIIIIPASSDFCFP